MTFSRASEHADHHRPHRGPGGAARPARRQHAAGAAPSPTRAQRLQDLSALPVRGGAVPPPPRISGRALDMRRASARRRDEPVRIAMWSGPRNLSTAMMRSFGNRPDCAVTDEPFYAAYLQLTGLDHPMREEILRHHETDWRKVDAALAGPPPGGKRICVPEAHDAPHAAGDRARLHARLPARLPDPPSGAGARLLCRQARGGRVRRHRLCRSRRRCSRRRPQSPGKAPPVVDADALLADPRGCFARSARRSNSLQRADAELAARPARRGRDLGVALVRRGEPLDRLRAGRAGADARRPASAGDWRSRRCRSTTARRACALH